MFHVAPRPPFSLPDSVLLRFKSLSLSRQYFPNFVQNVIAVSACPIMNIVAIPAVEGIRGNRDSMLNWPHNGRPSLDRKRTEMTAAPSLLSCELGEE